MFRVIRPTRGRSSPRTFPQIGAIGNFYLDQLPDACQVEMAQDRTEQSELLG
jgi:hypothetical protein